MALLVLVQLYNVNKPLNCMPAKCMLGYASLTVLHLCWCCCCCCCNVPVSVPQPGSKMVTSAKSAVPTVTDQAAAMQLGQCAKNLATCLAELRTATQKVNLLFVVVSCFYFLGELGDLLIPDHTENGGQNIVHCHFFHSAQ